jgi:hypothetical protein
MRIFGPGLERRGGVYTDKYEVSRVTFPGVSEDPFVDTRLGLPVALQDMVALPKTDSSLAINAAASTLYTESSDAERLRLAMRGLDIKVAFRNPFLGGSTRTRARWESNEAVAPNALV